MRYLLTIGITLVSLFDVSPGLATAGSAETGRPEVVPLVRLIALPEQYAGREVITFGLLKIGFKEDLLYMSTDDANNEVIPNGLDLEFTEPSLSRETVGRFSGKVVMVRGRFEPTPNAFGRVSAGILSGISEVVPADEWQK